jgi:hypothetical protein
MAKKTTTAVKKKSPSTKKVAGTSVVRAKNPGGRPPMFSSPQVLQEKCDEYFESCWIDKITESIDKDGTCTMTTVRYQNRPYTISGLAVYLGFNSRQSLLNYENDPKFLDIIKKAKFKVEMNIEEALIDSKSATGPIFWLKNHAGYTDTQQLQHTGKDGEALSLTINFITPAPRKD